jgi:hypothetical protein
LAAREAKDVRCPFCGAPYKKLIPPDALQLKCDYCGAMYRVPPRIGVEIPQWANHPDRFAVGICDDCGRNFCNDCLDIYDFKTRDGSATLHLCPECLNKRETDKANSYILGGVVLTLVGFFFTAILAPAGAPIVVGIFIVIMGIVEIVYGVNQRPSEEAEAGAEKAEAETGEEAPEPAEAEEREEADALYDELLNKYIEHWGTPTGPELLDNEIKAYTWHGDTFEQAVTKVYKRQQKNR